MKRFSLSAALFLLLPASPFFAQGGALDPTFGSNGKITTDIRNGGSDLAYAAVSLPDGKFLVAGTSYNGSTFDFSLARFLPDGSPDTAFGSSGSILADFSGGNDYAYAVALQPDGKIVVGGYTVVPPPAQTSGDFALARFLPDGSPDYSFGASGKVTKNLSSGTDIGQAVLIQADGKIILAGSIPFGDQIGFAMVRYLPDGTPDIEFGAGGVSLSAIGSGDAYVHAAALQPDGKILLGGEASDDGNTETDYALARFLPNGDPDLDFADGGVVLLDFSGKSDILSSIALQSGGNIVLAGSAILDAAFDFALARVLPDGAIDSTFGDNGRVATDFNGGSDIAEDVLVLDDGTIAVAGYTFNGADFDFALARYLPDGAPDTGFGSQGILSVAVSDDFDWCNAATAFPNGDIVAAGFSWSGTDFDFALFRCDATGNPDPDFGVDGIRFIPIGISGDAALACALQPDGNIVAVGATSDGVSDFGLARFLPDGALDPSFGAGGKVVSDIGFGDDFANAVAIQPDGKILAGGRSLSGTTSDFSLARYLPDGSLDTGFGDAGIRITSIGPGSDIGRVLALQADGKIILAGSTVSGPLTDFALVRYEPDGDPDPGFGSGGVVILSIGDLDAGYALTLQPDGKIILGGSTVTAGNHEIILIRLLPDGSPDPDFADGGILTQALSPGLEDIHALAVQSDGKIVAAGGIAGFGGNQDFLLLRFLSDGTPDAGFGDNGVASLDFGGTDLARSVGLLDDGRIVLGGYTRTLSLNYDFALACFLPNGAPDNNFGVGGAVATDFDATQDQINGIAIQSDNRIVAAGYAVKGADRDFALARYLPGLSVGVLNFATNPLDLLVYPNPIRHQATLEYSLPGDDDISIRLLDAQGKLLRTFVEHQRQQAGGHQQILLFPDTLPTGWYVLMISGEKGQQSVRVLVE